MYHNLCWANAKYKVTTTKPKLIVERDVITAISDIEIIHSIENEVLGPSHKVLDMNIVNKVYKQILIENGHTPETLQVDYKNGHTPETLQVDYKNGHTPETLQVDSGVWPFL